MSEDSTQTADPRDRRETTREETGRSRRIPLGTPQAKLKADIRPGYVGRWINDDGDRLDRAVNAGYEFAEDQNIKGRDKRQKRRVGVKEGGEPLFAYLMEIRKEFYDEDEAARMGALKEMDAAMLAGVPAGADAQRDRVGFYQPNQHPTTVDTSTG